MTATLDLMARRPEEIRWCATVAASTVQHALLTISPTSRTACNQWVVPSGVRQRPDFPYCKKCLRCLAARGVSV